MAEVANLLLILTILLSTYQIPAKPANVAAAATTGSAEFIRKACSTTLYPTLCFNSLSPYSNNKSMSITPFKLSQLATSISLSRLQALSSRVSSFSSPLHASAGARTSFAKALKDCGQLLGNAVDTTKDSMAELDKLKNGKKINETESKWRVSNIQTWMSAVLTSEETCTDGLEAAGVGDRAAVIKDVGVAKEYTSIALALVNKLMIHVSNV